MGTSLLQEFLSSRLLDIGAEDSRLEKLEDTCGELAKTYSTSPQSALPPLLAAWDPSAGEDPSLLQIGSVLQNHWPTYRGAFKGEPLTLYRAVVLESVMRAMESQGVLAVAVSLIAANILPQLKVGREARILDILVGRADAITAERLEQAWPDPSSPTDLTPLNVPAMKNLGKIDENAWFAQVGCPVSDLWHMQNGYALASRSGLDKIAALLLQMDDAARSVLAGHLRIGLHQDVEVTDGPTSPGQLVSQAFCSALPV